MTRGALERCCYPTGNPKAEHFVKMSHEAEAMAPTQSQKSPPRPLSIELAPAVDSRGEEAGAPHTSIRIHCVPTGSRCSWSCESGAVCPRGLESGRTSGHRRKLFSLEKVLPPSKSTKSFATQQGFGCALLWECVRALACR